MNTEDRLLAHKRAVDAERRAQAILKRRHATQQAMQRMAPPLVLTVDQPVQVIGYGDARIEDLDGPTGVLVRLYGSGSLLNCTRSEIRVTR